MYHQYREGYIEVICGCMFAGKTEELIRRINVLSYAKQKILVFITQMLILIGFLAIWEILANANIIDSFITSKPSRIFNTFMNLSQNDLLKHILYHYFSQN